MPKHTFRLNGEEVTVDVRDDERLLWVLRDVLGVTGPKYGCGINVCKACTSHLNGRAVNPCAVPVGALKPTDEITTIEGLADTVDAELHPMQEAWLEQDVAQCGYCQPGQIMAAVALVRRVAEEGREVTDEDLDASATSAAAARTRGSSRRSGRRPGGCEGWSADRSPARSGRPGSQHILEEGAVPRHQFRAVHAQQALVPGHPQGVEESSRHGGRHARAEAGVGTGEPAAQGLDEEMLVRVPQPVVDVRFIAAVNQCEEDTACGAAEVEEEFGEAFAQALQWYVEQRFVVERQVHRLQEQQFLALEVTDHQGGVRAGLGGDLADGGP